MYGLSKDGTLRDKSSNWWDTPEEAQENIKRIFNIDMVQESTRGNMKMKRRRIIKERSYRDELLIKQALEAAIKAKKILDDAANTIRDAVGETFLFARLDTHSMDLDDTIDDIKAVLAGKSDATDDEYVSESRKRFGSKFVKESEEETEWFDDRGELVKPLPGACVVDCSGSGSKDDEVDDWMRGLGFDIGLPVAKAVQFLKEFGAWDDLDLLAEIASTGDIRKMRQWISDNGNDMDERAYFDAAQMAKRLLAQRILWEFCNEIRDRAYDTSEEDLESVGLSSDIRDWDDEDWVKFQKEYSYCSLNS